MRLSTLLPTPARSLALALLMGAVVTGCGDAPEAVNAPLASSEAGSSSRGYAPEAPADPLVTGPEVMETPEDSAPAVGREPSAPVVTPAPEAPARPAAPAPASRPATPPVTSMPLPERPPMTAPPAPKPADTSGADAFWTRFQAAVKRQDRAAIEAGLAQTIRVGDRTFARSSEPVQDVITAVVTQEEVKDAYLAVDRLTHGATGSTFRTTITYEMEGETYDVVVFGTVARVASGEWKLVEVGSEG